MTHPKGENKMPPAFYKSPKPVRFEERRRCFDRGPLSLLLLVIVVGVCAVFFWGCKGKRERVETAAEIKSTTQAVVRWTEYGATAWHGEHELYEHDRNKSFDTLEEAREFVSVFPASWRAATNMRVTQFVEMPDIFALRMSISSGFTEIYLSSSTPVKS